MSIIETGTREIQVRLSRGLIDLGLCLVEGPGYEAEHIASEDLLFVAPAGTPRRKALPLSALADHPLVLPGRGNPLRDFIDQRADAAGFSLDVVLEVDGYAPRLNSVATGIGGTLIGAGPVPSVVRESGLCIMPFAQPGLERPIFLGRRAGLDSTVAARVAESVATCLGEIGLASH